MCRPFYPREALTHTMTTVPASHHLNGRGRHRADAASSSVELFSGAGGLALGIEQAGFRHVALVEWDKHACATLRENSARGAVAGHGWPVFEGDVRALDFQEHAGDVALLAGGAPCQPFSLGGKQRGDGDARNMFPEVFRALRELRHVRCRD